MDERIFSRRFCCDHEDGRTLYPYRVRNRETGTLRFRVSEVTVKGDLQDEVEKDEMERRFNADDMVRMRDPNGDHNGGYRISSPCIKRVRRLK